MRGIAIDSNVLNFVDLMQRTLLSRPNLQKVVRMADLDLGSTTDPEDILTELRQRISIVSDSRNLFTITYTGPNRDNATKVIRSLLNVFVDTNLGNSRQDMQVARTFIDEQLSAYAKQLDQADKRIADFRAKNAGFLPGNDNYMTKLELAKQQAERSQTNLDDAVHQRDELKNQLASVPQYTETVDSGGLGAGPPIGGAAGPAGPSGPDPQLHVADLEQKLKDLLQVDTEQHPDVVQLKRELDAAKKEAAAAQEKAKQGDTADAQQAPAPMTMKAPNPVYDQLTIQLVTLQSTIASLKAKAERDQAEVDKWQSVAASAPEIQTEMSKMSRDYDVIRKSYDELLSRRESAKIGNDLDTQTQAVQYRIIDPPDAPPTPVAPNRPLMLSAVFVAALGSGIGLAFLLANLDDTVKTLNELVESFGIPVVGAVTLVALPARRRRFKRQVFTFAVTCFALFIAYGGVMSTVLLLYRTT